MATTKAFELAQLSALADVTASDTTLSDELVLDGGSLTLDGGRNVQWGGALGSGFPALWGHSTNKQIKFAPDGNTSGMLYQMTATQLEVNPTTTSTTSTSGALVVAGGAGIAENLNVGGNIVVTGDLTVEGTQVTLNTTALDVEDKNITLNYHASNDTSASADGAGITIQDAVDASNDASILWNATNSAFDFSHEITAPSALTLTSNAPRIFLYESDTTDLNTALFSSGGAFTIRTTTDDDSIRTTRLEVSHSTGDIGFYENNGGTPQVGMHWDYADGRLGIGTTTPDSLLDVKIAEDTLANVLANEIYAATFLSTTSGNTGHTTAIMLSGSSGTNRGVAIAAETQSTGNDHDMIFATSASGSTPAEHVRITSDGKVGIGNSNPQHKIHFGLQNGYYTSIGSGNRTPGGSEPWLGVFDNSNIASATHGWGFYDSNADGSFQIWNKNNSTTGYNTFTIKRGGNVGIDTDNPETKLDVRVDSNSAYTSIMSGIPSYTPGTSDIIQVRNTESGVDDIYAGIWFETGNPASNTQGTDRSGRIALLVDNNDGYSSNFVFQTRSSDGQLKEKMRITQEGYVGIGTTDPAVSLHIGDGTTDEFVIIDKGTSSTSGILFRNAGNNKVKLQVNSSEELEIHTNNTRKARINELGTVYNYTSEPNIKPVLSLDFTNTDKLDHRVSFSRKNAATYVDKHGYVKVAPHGTPRLTHDPTTLEPLGLLIEPFAKNQLHKWAHADTTYSVTNGYIRPRDQILSPAGDMTAMKMVTINNGSGQTVFKPQISLDSSTGWHTFSIYMKKAEHRYFMIRSDNQSNWCLFDLDTGTVDTSGNTDAYDIYGVMTAHNNGWWRIEYTHYVNGGTGNDTEVFFSDVNRNGTVSTSYGDGVYIWGMQMEAQTQEKMRATSLIPSTVYVSTTNQNRSTFTNSDGNVIRSGVGSRETRNTYGLWDKNYLPAGIMVEDTSTNKVRSHNPGIDQAGWVISNVDMDWSQTTTAPDGITTLPLFADTSSNSRHSISHTTQSAQTSGGWNSWSFWIKPSSLDNIHLEMGYQGAQYSAVQITFDNAVTDPVTGITTGLIGIGSTAKDGLIIGYPNGWYHVRYNTIATSNGSTYAYFAMKDDAGNISYTGDGTSGFWLWGMQIEFNTYWPTSLIETNGTEVTRALDTTVTETAVRYEDVARIENYHFKDLYDNREGTLYADAAFGRGGRIGIYWDGDNDQIEMYNQSTTDTMYGFMYNDLATQVSLSVGTAPYNQVSHKHALAWRDNDSSIFYRNGAVVGTDNTVNVPSYLKYLNLGYYIDDKVHGISIFKKVQYYNRRLDGVNLQALTEND